MSVSNSLESSGFCSTHDVYFLCNIIIDHAYSATPIHFNVIFLMSFSSICFKSNINFFCTGTDCLFAWISVQHHKILWCNSSNNHSIAFLHFVDYVHRKPSYVQNVMQKAEAFSTQLESKFLGNLWGDCFLVTILLHGVDTIQIIRAGKENDSGLKKNAVWIQWWYWREHLKIIVGDCKR